MRLLRISTAALAVPLVLLATGCGESSNRLTSSKVGGNALDLKGPSNEAMTAEQLSANGEKSVADLKNLRIEAKGEVYGTPITADLKLGASQNIDGEASIGGKTIELVVLDKTAYVKVAPGTVQTVMDLSKKAEAAAPSPSEGPSSPADAAFDESFTKMFTEAAKLIEGKYVKIPGLDPAKVGAGAAGGGGIDGLLDDVMGGSAESGETSPGTDEEKSTEEVTKGAVTEIDGIKVIPLTAKDTETGSVSVLYVAANGTPFPIRATGDDNGDGKFEASIDLKYTKLTKDVTPKAPPAGETVDLEALMKSFGGGLFGSGDDEVTKSESTTTKAGFRESDTDGWFSTTALAS